ncbi:hypothetical protein CC80DRAFT_578708 [Byssothecium circinans]|uniref:Uncharacterized protein n=1 Tax=Byssothecium circinans TaxID=147558 RepID=A0A6A5TBB2_9PLEO|nr:hypothetical protein CC80DRAFT_578708 [Byssothecium circinans]
MKSDTNAGAAKSEDTSTLHEDGCAQRPRIDNILRSPSTTNGDMSEKVAMVHERSGVDHSTAVMVAQPFDMGEKSEVQAKDEMYPTIEVSNNSTSISQHNKIVEQSQEQKRAVSITESDATTPIITITTPSETEATQNASEGQLSGPAPEIEVQSPQGDVSAPGAPSVDVVITTPSESESVHNPSEENNSTVALDTRTHCPEGASTPVIPSVDIVITPPPEPHIYSITFRPREPPTSPNTLSVPSLSKYSRLDVDSTGYKRLPTHLIVQHYSDQKLRRQRRDSFRKEEKLERKKMKAKETPEERAERRKTECTRKKLIGPETREQKEKKEQKKAKKALERGERKEREREFWKMMEGASEGPTSFGEAAVSKPVVTVDETRQEAGSKKALSYDNAQIEQPCMEKHKEEIATNEAARQHAWGSSRSTATAFAIGSLCAPFSTSTAPSPSRKSSLAIPKCSHEHAVAAKQDNTAQPPFLNTRTVVMPPPPSTIPPHSHYPTTPTLTMPRPTPLHTNETPQAPLASRSLQHLGSITLLPFTVPCALAGDTVSDSPNRDNPSSAPRSPPRPPKYTSEPRPSLNGFDMHASKCFSGTVPQRTPAAHQSKTPTPRPSLFKLKHGRGNEASVTHHFT